LQIPDTWAAAIDAFENSRIARRIFDDTLVDNFVMTKRQELHYFAELSEEQQLELYLDTV
jgi:glutamine synthetase